MATLHMDIESVRTVQTNINNAHSSVTTEVSNVTTQVQGMVGTLWIGNSATEFLNEYENWRTTTNQLLDALSTLSARLGNEIAEWEAMAAALS
jgi:WXG100 family type VII secretion target